MKKKRSIKINTKLECKE